MVPSFLFQHGHGATIFAQRKRVFVYKLYGGVGLFENLLFYKRCGIIPIGKRVYIERSIIWKN